VDPNPSANPLTGEITVSGSVLQILQQRSASTPPVQLFTDVPANSPYADDITLLRQAGITVEVFNA
jgi:hypothetical protein